VHYDFKFHKHNKEKKMMRSYLRPLGLVQIEEISKENICTTFEFMKHANLETNRLKKTSSF